eukprot:CAMPEP_0197523294 /NCGR_PEP_ID=MMETSP1318-20131121/8257_1 /TAXON_ID=552666 /ORGANISM="Partenskyella glossopodia, Strain RCC365" /LENGTH=160 /DNA_ID=CAMNT_0043075945 /DNA_START=81 /DNA_END=563 /DNA_ORIENTATION=+
MAAYKSIDEESFMQIPQESRKTSRWVVGASVALNVVLLAGICMVLFSGSSSLGAPTMARTATRSMARFATPTMQRNTAMYAQKTSAPMKFQKAAKLGAMSAASSAALLSGVAKAAEVAADNTEYIYQTGNNPPLVEFAWGMFGAMFTMSIALVVFGRSGL